MAWDTEKYERFKVEYDKMQYHLDKLMEEFYRTLEKQTELSEAFNESMKNN